MANLQSRFNFLKSFKFIGNIRVFTDTSAEVVGFQNQPFIPSNLVEGKVKALNCQSPLIVSHANVILFEGFFSFS